MRLEAAGKPIDTAIGHAAPHVCDFYGTGKMDLLVGQFGDGRLWVYRNEGTKQQPYQTGCVDPVAPAYEYDHSGGACGVIGGVVSRDPDVPALLGRYLFSDLCTGHIWSATLSDDGTLGAPEDTGLDVGSPTSFGVDAAGQVYVMTLGGDVDRFDAAS